MNSKLDDCRCGSSICASDEGEANDDLGLTRRGLIQIAAAGASGVALPMLGGKWILAEEGQSFEHLIPSEKHLDPNWVASLFQRTEPEVFAGWDKQLKYIGMPIGGIGCGQLYLGGDGRLWLWDIFKSNYRREPDHGQRLEFMTLCGHYTDPVAFGEQYNKHNGADVKQGFAIRVRVDGKSVTRTLDHEGFPAVSFRGEYPIGKISYVDDALPIKINLEAFSPFIPLDARDSALPATVMSFTVTNIGGQRAEVDLAGWLQNATCPYVDEDSPGRRRNRIVRTNEKVTMLATVEPLASEAGITRENILFADFEANRYKGWTCEGNAMGDSPYRIKDIPDHATVHGGLGDHVVNTHNVRAVLGASEMQPRQLSLAGDRQTGKLTSDTFIVERNYISFLISGGGHAEKTCLNVLIDDEIVASRTGRNDHLMRFETVDVRKYAGKQARLQIVDSMEGGWGNICVDQIVFSDILPEATGIEAKHGYGSMALSLLTDGAATWGDAALTDLDDIFKRAQGKQSETEIRPLNEELVGCLGTTLSLVPGESMTLDFAISWYFPDHHEIDAAPGSLSRIQNFKKLRRHYAPRFSSAGDVASYLAENKEHLFGTTRLWNKTWYDSTLPHWLLDRTFIAIDCAATQVLHWFDTGRLYGWEGVDCCPGTCTHVWHYAQSLSRIFPELERAFREITDFGIAFHEKSGLIGHRADNHSTEATDGQAGTIMRVYREHLMSADNSFLRRLWPKIRKSVEFMMTKDPDGRGLIDGTQPHTLDAAWHGPMGWISGLYLASLAAGAAMADEMDDQAFALQCREIVGRGKRNIVSELYDREYFIHKPDASVPDALRTGKGCHIDQVLGQAWAHQVGLARVIPKDETVSALNSLWRYNFAPDAGQYAIDHVEIEQTVRWYAMPGESGLVMCTWPKGGAKEAIPGDRLRTPKNPDVWSGPGGYFNECMNGFEYQVAAHMIYEGEPNSKLVKQGLAITRAVHDRYAADKRNPYNEIECSDHYARSMASYGVFLAVCGFEYNGPAGHIGFAPRLTVDNFRAPFTAAEGWGTYEQQRVAGKLACKLNLRYGELRLNSISTMLAGEYTRRDVKRVLVDGRHVDGFEQNGSRVTVTFDETVEFSAGEMITVEIF